MSYRDLRNFLEHLRLLGFPRPVSLESFREPNFPLLAELLKWLAERFDPESDVTGGPGSVEERIMVVRSAAKFMATKANIKLNTKKLYGADGYAVRELLKITSVLYEALSKKGGAEDADSREDTELQYDVSNKITEIKQARQLATEITGKGALLYDLLAKEPEYKEIREQALGRQLDMSHIESALQRATQAARNQIEAVREQIESVATTEATLNSKIEKKRAELERGEKRLQSMQKIKPAYQGELAALESELEALWDQYVLRHRCVEALKHQLSVVDSKQAEAAEEQQAAVLQLIHKYEAEDVLGNVSDSDEMGSSDEQRNPHEQKESRPATRPNNRLRIKTAAGRGSEDGQRGVFGSMSGARDELDDVPDEDDSPSDSDDLVSELARVQSRYGARSTLRAEDTMLSRFSARTHTRAPLAHTRTPLRTPLTRHTAADDDDDEDDFGDLVEGGEDADSLASSDESELQLGDRGRAGMGAGAASAAGGSASRRRAPSTKPTTSLHDIISDDEF